MAIANEEQVGGDHYKRNDGTIEHWDFAWQNGYDQFQYCITKYVHRHKQKNGLEDLHKALHHLQKYIELLEHDEDVAMQSEISKGYVRQG